MNDEAVYRTAPATPGLLITYQGADQGKHWLCYQPAFSLITLKSRVRETKHFSTDADSSTDAIGGWAKAKSAKKKTFFLRGNFRPLPNKNVQMLDHFFPLLFPKDSESLKILDIQLREVGAKRPVKKTENRRRPEKVKKKKLFFARRF